MTKLEIAAQAAGIVAMVFNVLSYLWKKQKTVITFQLLGSSFFAISFFMLGAFSGSIGNIITVFRATMFLNKEKTHAENPRWLPVYICLFLIMFVLNFTAFGKEITVFNLFTELLPFIGGLALSIGYFLKSASGIRKAGLVSSPCWLLYNIIVGSWGATLCEVFTLTSIFTGMIVNDRKAKEA